MRIEPSADIKRKSGALRQLRLLLIASVGLPLVFFANIAVMRYQAEYADAEQRLRRTADVVHEHALKVIDTLSLTIDRANDRVDDFADDRALELHEPELHQQFRSMIQDLPQIQDIYVFSHDGRALVSAQTFPLPADRPNFADRDYFQAQIRDPGIYISEVLRGRIDGSRFINVSKRRPELGGAFAGVTVVSVRPQYFEEFYQRIIREQDQPGMAIGMVRTDGQFLVRAPEIVTPEGWRINTAFLDAVRANPGLGSFTAISTSDGRRRLLNYKKLQGYPIYVTVSLPTGEIVTAWLGSMIGLFSFGIPATIGLFLITLLALRRTQREQAALSRAADEARRRQEAEAALHQAQKLQALGQLAGGVAHDFNNLLMVITGNAEMLRGRVNEAGVRFVEMILRAAGRGDGLTRHLLSFARQQPVAPQRIDLAEFLPRAGEVIAGTIGAAIRFAVEVAPGTWCVEVDPGELELALLNLAVNARDAMPEGGTLTLKAHNLDPGASEKLRSEQGLEATGFVAVAMSDTGTGMSPEIAARAFEPFFTTKDINRGTGLGLSQIYGFARQAGGTATIVTAPGLGTTVSIILPRAAQPAPDASTEQGANQHDAVHAGLRVLIVEDEPEVARIIVEMLREAGAEPHCVANPQDALSLLRQSEAQRPDLLISDVIMPDGINGLELARRALDLSPGLATLLVTGYTGLDLDEAGFLVLRKPFDRAELSAAIEAALARAAHPGDTRTPGAAKAEPLAASLSPSSE